MEIQESHDLPLPVAVVWKALNDRDVLESAIPGCQELVQNSPTKLSAVVKVKIGPVSATFEGDVKLSKLKPPNSYVISGSGTGGVAGGASGSAKVRLKKIDKGKGTRLSYDVDVAVTGKIAQLGSRLIMSSAKKYAKTFFSNFITELSPEEEETDV
jgi:carbon monoxide dehydrogenase subunit G